MKIATEKGCAGLALVLMALYGFEAPLFAQGCGFAHAFDRPDNNGTEVVHVYEGRPDPLIHGVRPLLFVSDLHVNTDGTRISYHVADPRAQTRAINNILNAMHHGFTIADFEQIAEANWLPLARTWSILSDHVIERSSTTGRPCTDSAGYLVSMTSDVAVDGAWARVGDCDQSKWIDALAVPALVLPKPAADHEPTQFDARHASNRTPVIAMSLASDHRLAFGIVGDKGPPDELGEASVAMNRALNGLPRGENPANYHDAVARFEGPRSAILLFPGRINRLARPLTADRVEHEAEALFTRWGGQARLERCVAEIPEGR